MHPNPTERKQPRPAPRKGPSQGASDYSQAATSSLHRQQQRRGHRKCAHRAQRILDQHGRAERGGYRGGSTAAAAHDFGPTGQPTHRPEITARAGAALPRHPRWTRRWAMPACVIQRQPAPAAARRTRQVRCPNPRHHTRPPLTHLSPAATTRTMRGAQAAHTAPIARRPRSPHRLPHKSGADQAHFSHQSSPF